MKALLAALALVLAGCGGPRTDWTFTLDPAFSPEERATIRAAAEEWHRFAPRTHIDIADGPLRAPFVLRVAPGGTVDGMTVTGYTWDKGVILLAPGFTQPMIQHEFGHALGLDHTASGVMRIWAQADWTADDLDECQRVDVCD